MDKRGELREAIKWARALEGHELLAPGAWENGLRLLANAAEAALTKPMMPSSASKELLAAMVNGCAVHIPDPAPVMANIYHALRNELLKPKTQPQTVYDLTASGRTHAPYESHRVIFEAAKIGGCIEALHGEGFQRVVVTAREVPA